MCDHPRGTLPVLPVPRARARRQILQFRRGQSPEMPRQDAEFRRESLLRREPCPEPGYRVSAPGSAFPSDSEAGLSSDADFGFLMYPEAYITSSN